MIIAFTAALLCTVTRGVLNVVDRAVLRRQEVHFCVVVLYNNVLPMLVAYGVALPAPGSVERISDYLTHPGVIFSALGAQLAAQCFFFSFRQMTVKSVALSAKAADLVLPLVTLAITSYIPTRETLFSLLSVLAFVPIALSAYREKVVPRTHITLMLVAVLCFQCAVNSYFHMHRYADTWPKFLSMMAAILTWRSIFTGIMMAKSLMGLADEKLEALLKPLPALTLRATLAFIAQAAFFFSITRVGSAIAWPVLNSTPVISCCIAHVFLNERVAKAEGWALVSLVALSVSYLMIVY